MNLKQRYACAYLRGTIIPHSRTGRRRPSEGRKKRRTAKTASPNGAERRSALFGPTAFIGRDQGLTAGIDHRFRNFPREVITPHAVQFLAQAARATFFRSDPRPLPPRRVIADVLPMSAIKFSDPVIFGVEVVTDDFSVHVP
jgi:hypothetical protein